MILERNIEINLVLRHYKQTINLNHRCCSRVCCMLIVKSYSHLFLVLYANNLYMFDG